MQNNNSKEEIQNFENLLKKFTELSEKEKYYVLGFIQAKSIDCDKKVTA